MATTDEAQAQQPAVRAGDRLRAAREAAGRSLANIAEETRIPERQLILIEEGNFAAMASRTYAVGFSRTYAREVGLDEQEIAQMVRQELGASEAEPERHATTFEPGDPARVPGSRLAWLAALGAIAVVGLVLYFWRSYYLPAVPLPDLTSEQQASPAPSAPAPVASAAPAVSGPVVLTATQPRVWVKVYDAAGAQLFQKEMALNETYTVPANANGPLLRTARPDALRVTIGGKPVPPLADRQMTIKDVPVSAAALLARGMSSQPTSPPTGTGTVTE